MTRSRSVVATFAIGVAIVHVWINCPRFACNLFRTRSKHQTVIG